MNQRSCPHEQKTADAARTGRWEDSVRAHVLECPDCREIAGIAEWMNRIAAADTLQSRLPDPEQLFGNAQIAAIQAAQEKALLPLAIAESVVRITILLTLAAAALWTWFGLRSLAALQTPYPYMPQYALSAAAALAPCVIALAFARLAQPMLTGK